MNQLIEKLNEPWDITGLAVFRICFGAMMVFSTVRFALKGWIFEFYIAPRYHFTYAYFDWVQPLPGYGMYVLFGIMTLAALGICFGLFYRLSAIFFFLIFTYVELLDKTYYLNHYVFVSLVAFLLIWMPANRFLSLDVRLGFIKVRQIAPAWCQMALRLQIGMLYVLAGIAKLEPDWLIQAQPLRIWLQASADMWLLGPMFDLRITAILMSWAGLIYDLSIPFFLMWRPVRAYAFATVVIFHGMTALLFPIGVFPWVMMVASSAFFDPSWPRRCLVAPAGKPKSSFEPRGTKPVLGMLVLFFLIQASVPFRYLAYDGNVLWHERGFRFSWRVMLVEKTGHADLTVVDSTGLKQERVNLKEWLTPQQEKMMSTQPDMLVQFAKYLAQGYRAKGWQNPKVYGDVWVSLNGRSRKRLVDPLVDLAQQTLSPGEIQWILEAPK